MARADQWLEPPWIAKPPATDRSVMPDIAQGLYQEPGAAWRSPSLQREAGRWRVFGRTTAPASSGISPASSATPMPMQSRRLPPGFSMGSGKSSQCPRTAVVNPAPARNRGDDVQVGRSSTHETESLRRRCERPEPRSRLSAATTPESCQQWSVEVNGLEPPTFTLRRPRACPLNRFQRRRVAGGIAAPGSHRSRRDSLPSSGSSHPLFSQSQL